MKCIFLCAGYATRLYPLTNNFPKPLLKVGEKAILDWLIDDISRCEMIDEYIVVSNHRYFDYFNEWSKLKQQNVLVIDDGTTSNENRLGAVCDIRFALDELHISEDVLVIAGDNVLDFSLTKFIDYSLEKKTACIMRYYEANEAKLSKSAIVTVDENDRIIKMEEKPTNPFSNWCCPPFYYYSKENLQLIQKGIEQNCGTDAPGYFAAWLSNQVAVHAMEMPGNRYDIGDVDGYQKINSFYSGIVE